MCIWQSQAFAGALSFGGSVPVELVTVTCASLSDESTTAAPKAALAALAKNIRRMIPFSAADSSLNSPLLIIKSSIPGTAAIDSLPLLGIGSPHEIFFDEQPATSPRSLLCLESQSQPRAGRNSKW
jgi:hypothetical protein